MIGFTIIAILLKNKNYHNVVVHFGYLFVGLLVVVHWFQVLVLWLLQQINNRKTVTC
jgi:hypothetical protein